MAASNDLLRLMEPYLDQELVAVWTDYEAGEEEGDLIAEVIGELIGELKSGRRILQLLLTQRFGPLTSAHLERLESVSLKQLDAMTLRVLTAASVEEVLGTQG